MHARVYSRKRRCFFERYYSVRLCPVFQTLPCNSTFVFPNVYDDDSHYEDEVRRLSFPDLATSQFLKSFSLLLWILLCVINMNKYPNPRRCVRCVTIEMPRLCEDAKKIHQQQKHLRRAIGECKRIGGTHKRGPKPKYSQWRQNPQIWRPSPTWTGHRCHTSSRALRSLF